MVLAQGYLKDQIYDVLGISLSFTPESREGEGRDQKPDLKEIIHTFLSVSLKNIRFLILGYFLYPRYTQKWIKLYKSCQNSLKCSKPV